MIFDSSGISLSIEPDGCLLENISGRLASETGPIIRESRHELAEDDADLAKTEMVALAMCSPPPCPGSGSRATRPRAAGPAGTETLSQVGLDDDD